jgi:hypothetical protein
MHGGPAAVVLPAAATVADFGLRFDPFAGSGQSTILACFIRGGGALGASG